MLVVEALDVGLAFGALWKLSKGLNGALERLTGERRMRAEQCSRVQ